MQLTKRAETNLNPLSLAMMKEFDLVDVYRETHGKIQKIKDTPTNQKRLNFVRALTYF